MPDAELDALLPQGGPLLQAVIDEAHCIGCTLCIAACPVDAIVGANKRMHTVLPDLCIGCNSCVPPCPVDCIDMVPAGRDWTVSDETAARARHRARGMRLARLAADNARLMADATRRGRPEAAPTAHDAERKRSAVESALARARARRIARQS
jgi:electron transport complex protein RnfB